LQNTFHYAKNFAMQHFISDFSKQVGTTVTVKGWAYNVRSSGSLAFIQIRDGSGFAQAVINKSSVSEADWNTALEITLESSIELTGQVTKHPKQEGVFELQVTAVTLIQKAPEYPIGKKEHGPDFLLDNRHLWLRTPTQWAIQRVRTSRNRPMRCIESIPLGGINGCAVEVIEEYKCTRTV
jgi:asparaginyl-tRNA synthetase